MQARGLTLTCKQRACVVALVASVLGGSGCGGGTTGTSPSETFKLVGITEGPQQSPLPDTSMSVLSGADDQLLIESQTDRNGDFAMELPSDEQSLIVDVQGVKSAPLERRLLGEGIVSTKLRQDGGGALSFAETFEVQIDKDALCPALIAQGDQISQHTEWNSAIDQSCPVRFLVRSRDLPISTVQVSLQSECDVSIQSRSAEPDGTLAIDVAELLNSGCERAEIIVSARGSSLLSAVFSLSLIP